jgi:hypothetical protein
MYVLYIYEHVNAYVPTYIYVHINAYVPTYIHTYIDAHIYEETKVLSNASLQKQSFESCTYIHTRTHTYIHTYMDTKRIGVFGDSSSTEAKYYLDLETINSVSCT